MFLFKTKLHFCFAQSTKTQFSWLWKRVCGLKLNIVIFMWAFFVLSFKVYKATGEEFLKIAGGKWCWSSMWLFQFIRMLFKFFFFPWMRMQIDNEVAFPVLSSKNVWPCQVVETELWAFELWCSQTALLLGRKTNLCRGSIHVSCINSH